MDIEIPSFHDGHLTGIDLASRRATLGFACVDGRRYELVLSELEALQVEDFREGNIVYALEIVRGRSPPEFGLKERMERIFPSPHASAAANYHDAHAKFLANKIAKIEEGSATLVIVTSSYGADLVAFCAAVELRELSAPAP